ncbi:DUF1353 domain-containing protein [Kiloniella laminariae]|uniref:DUF1353 domain-containing protein n=1 Tax=Kiloniella laminariae TaxID=454162 RepID=UPI000362215F|nr:DUF1353 domain-containing protein [Kiloniella laminariae]
MWRIKEGSLERAFEVRPEGVALLTWISAINKKRPFSLPYSLEYRGPASTVFMVPLGFQFDGSSAPRFLWWLLPPADHKIFPAALAHDFLYEAGILSRAMADLIFRDIMFENDVPSWKAEAAYRVVRQFGRSRFNASNGANPD